VESGVSLESKCLWRAAGQSVGYDEVELGDGMTRTVSWIWTLSSAFV
jgi:hypothetical protein